jgi:hypothetical protein
MRYILIVSFLFVTSLMNPARAQSQSTFKRTTATVLFSSIGGGILGLSTLSFYGKPQEHTDNITTGVLLGFIAGVSYVMYDNYGQQAQNPPKPLFEMAAHFEQKKRGPSFSWPLLSLEYSW